MRLLLLLSPLLLLSSLAAASLDYCSSQNLGSDQTTSIYQSNGKCGDTCSGKGYALAIVQNKNCWCSNYVPEDTVSTDKCDNDCPGYPSDKCGGDGYYGYILISTPSGTEGGSSASSTTSSTSSTSTSSTSTSEKSSVIDVETTAQISETIQVTETTQITQTQDHSSYASETSSSSSSSSSKSSSSSSSASPSSYQPTTIYSVRTVNGSQTQLVKTQYVTANPTSNQASASATSELSSNPKNKEDDSNNKSFFDSKGKVAGTFTAVGIVVVGLVASILYCCCCCAGGGRDGSHDDFTDEENQYSSDELSMNNEKAAVPASFTNNDHSKTPSTVSSTHLKRNSSSKSILSLFSPSGAGVAGSTAGGMMGRSLSKKRLNPNKHSRNDLNASNNGNTNNNEMMFPISEFDSRLDPHTMFLNTNESNKTLADNQDYSRRILHITNPE
ncbi:hypothetical protein HYPBUDRAFT_147197 [Hyphopichia burtonii NRRL Y-1933]|uniref:WSC domain-containing protein n=1 Tax=Hyphopichia burtonii NRRL Y-1933 TaxID=984485 RepID=A0A1E4RMZ3_9ASCO|nr:hypothetical protein HYPBUDRAFT_147197 [Hyphopichia burtonii NRRL Y-1933]ODV68648.1 hypothetical protein HYPBUDRAFT_147197 [Hyphopichia burtonii NRRL Y-1933]